MTAGTIKLTNGSTAVVGTGTTFTSDLKSGDVITATVGGIFFTLFVSAVTNNTALILTDPFTGPTTSGLAWVAVPQLTLNRITAALAAQTAESVRRVLQENANWQTFYTGTGDITVTLPDGTPTGRPVTGPSWAKITNQTNAAVQWRGALPANANLNSYGPTSDFIGIWSFATSGGTVANGFPENNAQGILEVFSGGPWLGTQRFTHRDGNIYTRTLTAAWNATTMPWSAWNLAGYRPNSTYVDDCDLMKSAGAFPCRAATLNKPTGVTQGGWLFVTDHVAAGNILQIYHTATTAPADQANRRYTRTFNGTVWSGWKLLGGTDALNDLGYGLTASSRITSFDWQQADFLTGSMQTFVFSSSLNPPSGVSYNTNTTVTATTIQKNSNAAVIKLNSLSASNGDKSEYIIVVTGTAGSRSFNVVRSYNSDSSTVIPVANGGTGAKTPTDARNAISASVGGVTVSGAFSNIISVDPGFYSINGGNFSDPANGDFGSLFSAGTYGSGLNGQIFIRNDGTSLLYRGGSNATVRTVYSTANTTVDSNGFIKKSSPVSNIFSDGRCINNDESEGVTVTRQAVGVYLLEGCMGLNADAAWGGIDGGFEIPLDRNKQPRIWLDYEVSQDGSVLVKTYHRTHPSAPKFARNECEGIADGDPVDIPADSFISVRIEMPEDSIYNKKMEEAAQKLAEEEADRIRAEQERQKTEVDPKEQPDVQH
ncbi:pyocin knob domain-containing protein [Leclercia adecarboxylata]|uniref:pyocin knob domain-containing protein n=2 Tax=Leclercia adecarboxylata TaxID=83655 RepID=UPI0022DFFDFD|nr:hypothetical protein [Leclercia adecarboxylata]MDU6821185.1 hypothetical protein [Leclercia adecarboxylata]WJT02192.1 hypothetical protein OCT50_16500 [Leclercia adecarboxylata]